MDDRVKITVMAGEEEEATANDAVIEATKRLGADIKREESGSGGKRRGMVELSNLIIWIVSGGAGLTAEVLGNLIYDKLVAAHFRPKVTSRNEKREILIVDKSTGLRISIKEEITENG
jgi:hypothetical protein